MPESLTDIYAALEKLARYDGPWDALRQETARLSDRVAELKERETRLDDLLVVALVGGSGVGKSTLLNAIAGDELAQTSEMRPCTTHPTVYHPPGARLPFPEDWRRVSGSALENLVLIDTPDSDTIVAEHRARVVDVLRECDLVVLCADAEKYLDEASWSLLRPLVGERTMACIETKATRADSVRDHWLERLREKGFAIDQYFRVDGRRTFDRKVSGSSIGDDEFDFGALEVFLADELSRERIARIKRSNSAGLLQKTVAALDTNVADRAEELDALKANLDALARDALGAAEREIDRRIFAQPHLWAYALGREISVRSKGLVGTVYRMLEAARTLPARLSTWSLLRGTRGGGQSAAALLTEHDLVANDFDLDVPALEDGYRDVESSAHLQLSRAGFALSTEMDGYARFVSGLSGRVSVVLSGSARDGLSQRAARMTSWPVAILIDIPPVAFFGYSGYHVVVEYFSGTILPGTFFLHAGGVLGVILVSEIAAFSMAARALAWRARRAARSAVLSDLSEEDCALVPERAVLGDAREAAETVRKLTAALQNAL